MDVVDAFATDALLSKLGLTMLEDDLNFFPPYCGELTSDKALVDGGPQLAGDPGAVGRYPSMRKLWPL